MTKIPSYLELYQDSGYFVGNGRKSGYDDYRHCRGVLWDWASMVDALAHPTSILDVGAAYGYLVEWYTIDGVTAWGIEPSDFARSQAPDHAVPYLVAGALPDLPELPVAQFDVVTCTEVLEHVPEEIVPASLAALAAKSSRLVICLIMLEGPGADGDEGHICLKSRAWWEEQFAVAAPAFAPRRDLEDLFNNDPYSIAMYWQTRFFVYERIG